MVRVLRANWFYLLLPFLLLAAWSLSRTPEAVADPLLLERVLLVDCLISLPVLYFLFLRRHATLRAAIIRSAVLAGAGLWFAGYLMPAGEGQILPALGWVRMAALPLLILLELAAFIAIMRVVYSDTPDEEQLVRQGVPPLVIKLMLAEARFWKKVWRFLSGR